VISAAATALLQLLRMLVEPIVDREAADHINVSQREVIDLADELLAHGYPVCAAGRGRWLGSLRDLLEYERVTRQRALRILRRCRHIRQSIAKLQQDQTLFDDCGTGLQHQPCGTGLQPVDPRKGASA